MFFALNSQKVTLSDTNMALLSGLITIPSGCTRVDIQNRGSDSAYVGVKSGSSAPSKDDCVKLGENQLIDIHGNVAEVWVGADSAQSLVCIPYIGTVR